MSASLKGFKNPWVIIGVIAVLLIGGSVWYAGTVAETNNEGVTFSANIKGSETPVVTLVEYSDFECPACAAFQPVLQNVMDEFGESISLEFKHYPLPMHTLAIPAARAAEAAGQQGAFFAYHDLLFKNQATWAKTPNPFALFTQYAEELELDIEKFKRHYNASVITEHINASAREARGRNLTGTPTFFLNGVQMKIETYEDFRNQIATALGSSTASTTESKVQFGI